MMLSNLSEVASINRPVIIFGAGVVGEAAFYACKEKNIKIAFFCDNSWNKTKSKCCGLPVRHVSELGSFCMQAHFLISVADIGDIVAQLKTINAVSWSAATVLLKEFDISPYEFSAPKEFVEYAIDTCILCQEYYLNPDRLFLRSIDLIITERCSLKCKECSNLSQYYTNPIDCSMEELTHNLNIISETIDEINEVRVIGGEPLMNQEFHLIIEKLVSIEAIKKVVVYTNGTIVPRYEQWSSLKNSKVLFLITDYGDLSRNLSVLVQKLQDNHIDFYVRKAQGWTSCSSIQKRGRTVEEQKDIFRKCCAKNLATISNGKLYRCPFIANAARLKAIPEQDEDFVDLVGLFNSGTSYGKVKEYIRHFLTAKEYLPSCDYCSGRSLDAPEIIPAEQIKTPIQYNLF